MKLIWKIFVNLATLAIYDVLSNSVRIDSIATLVILAAVLTFANSYIRPIIKLIALPISILTFGIFSFFINAIIVHGCFSFVSGAHVNSFLTSIILAFVLSFVNGVMEKRIK